MGAEFVRRFIDNDDVVIATDTSEEALQKLSGSVGVDRLHTMKGDISEEADTKSGLIGPSRSRDETVS
jgi:hypothetical protein